MSKTYLIAEHADNQIKKVTLEVLGELQRQGVDPVVIVFENEREIQRGNRYDSDPRS